MAAPDDDLEDYWRMRRAVRDAIWDVIGTIVTVVVAVTLGFVGVAIVLQGLRSQGAAGLLPAAFGAVLVVGGAVLLAREFRLWPFS